MRFCRGRVDENDDPGSTSGDGSGTLPAIRRAWYKLTGAWPSKWSHSPAGAAAAAGGRTRGASAEKDFANEFKLLPAPGTRRAKQSELIFLPSGIVPRSAGIYEPAGTAEAIGGNYVNLADKSVGDPAAPAVKIPAAPAVKIPPLTVMIGWFNAEKKYVDQHIALYKTTAEGEGSSDSDEEVCRSPEASFRPFRSAVPVLVPIGATPQL